MYTKFSPPAGNIGSSRNLANYLDKEQRNGWFNDESENIETTEVVEQIDRNGKGQLGKDDWKFVEVEYNPSRKEQQRMIEAATGKKGVGSLGELDAREREAVKDEFRRYVRAAQDSQAKNYNRKNIDSGADLKYYAKIETQRRYKGTDDAVKQGHEKQGDLKKGLNMHAHIVQSRKAADRKTKLSPVSKHRKQTDRNRIQQGFDRNKFAKQVERDFDKKFGYNRDVKETLEYKKANKSNDYDLKQSLMENHNERNESPGTAENQRRDARERFIREQREKEQGPERSKELEKENKKDIERARYRDNDRDRGYSY